MLQNLSSAAVVIGALRVNDFSVQLPAFCIARLRTMMVIIPCSCLMPGKLHYIKCLKELLLHWSVHFQLLRYMRDIVRLKLRLCLKFAWSSHPRAI